MVQLDHVECKGLLSPKEGQLITSDHDCTLAHLSSHRLIQKGLAPHQLLHLVERNSCLYLLLLRLIKILTINFHQLEKPVKNHLQLDKLIIMSRHTLSIQDHIGFVVNLTQCFVKFAGRHSIGNTLLNFFQMDIRR